MIGLSGASLGKFSFCSIFLKKTYRAHHELCFLDLNFPPIQWGLFGIVLPI